MNHLNPGSESTDRSKAPRSPQKRRLCLGFEPRPNQSGERERRTFLPLPEGSHCFQIHTTNVPEPAPRSSAGATPSVGRSASAAATVQSVHRRARCSLPCTGQSVVHRAPPPRAPFGGAPAPYRATDGRTVSPRRWAGAPGGGREAGTPGSARGWVKLPAAEGGRNSRWR